MNITSDIIYSLIEKKFHKKSEKENKKQNNEEFELLTNGIIYNNSSISKLTFNSKEPKIIYNFENIEYLSLTNNYLRNINFIEYLPNIYYLDLFNNPIDDFSPLNIKNVFGYLRLSMDHFNENKVLQINGLTTVMFDIELKDTQLIKNITYNNPNIIMINQNINYIIDKVISKEQQKKTGRRISVMKINIDVFSDQNLNGQNLKIKNQSLLNLKKFFSRYTKRIDHILNVKNINSSFALRVYKEYLDIERNKLFLLNNCYLELSRLNSNINNYYINNYDFIYENIKINNIIMYGIGKKLDDNKAIGEDSLKVSLIILTSFLFFIIKVITKEMFITIVNVILQKYFHIKKEDLIPLSFNLFDSIFIISIYFRLYDDFIKKFDIENIKNIFYVEIIKILSMDKLILKANILYENNKKNKILFDSQNQKLIIKNKINFIYQLEIIEEFLILIQFLYDYILYEKIDKIFINNEIAKDYSLFIEFKESVEQNHIENTQELSLSDKKFNQIHLDILHQQFYFEQEKIKYMMNKIYPSRNKKIREIKNYYNFDRDYLPQDDIKVNDLFKIKKLNNNSFTYENNKRFYKLNNQIIKKNLNTSNNISQSKQRDNEELKILKEIINNNEILTNHTRMLINNEKKQKKLALIRKKEIENTEKNIQTKFKYNNNSNINTITDYAYKIRTNNFLPKNFSSLKKKILKINLPNFYSVKNRNQNFINNNNNNRLLRMRYDNYTDSNRKNELNSFLSITRYNEDEIKQKLLRYVNRRNKKPIKLNSDTI